MNDTNSLAHTKWNCKYHIVFAPKYRRKVFFGEKRREIGKILRQLCEWKKVAIVEAEVCPDHINILALVFAQHTIHVLLVEQQLAHLIARTPVFGIRRLFLR